ncbi:MAG: Na+/H+ antiporter subunit E [Hyphomonadaceae bacterium]|nr:Na+/H+ antiporter subunit E [Hyphomonadaceae bacterium]
MLHAAATAVGLSAIWILWTGAWSSPLELGFALSAGALATAAGLCLGGASRFFSGSPRIVLRSFARANAVMSGLRDTVAAVLGAGSRLRPALVRARVIGAAHDRVLLSFLLSATPGLAVVDSDGESLLVHTNDEDAPDATALAGLEPGGRGP